MLQLPEYEQEMDYAGILNNVLPPDIRVLGWTPVADTFHARCGICAARIVRGGCGRDHVTVCAPVLRFSTLRRTYRYFFVKRDLDIDVRVC